MELKNIDVFKAFIAEKAPRILLEFLYALVFVLVLYLCSVPLYGIAYAAIICAAIEFIVQSINFYKFSQKHKNLACQMKNIRISAGELPVPSGFIERDYDSLLRTVCSDRAEIISRNYSEKANMIDYYTTWVHQIKTPISAMRLILQSEDSSLSRELNTELFRIEQYVEMALAYLRMDSESTDYVIKKYSLDKVVKQAVRKYSPMFIHKKIGLNLEPIEAEVITDEKWLCFVIEQLLSNALKYTRSGAISIRAERDENVVALIISDTGIGIAAEDLPRVFDKGFTGYNGRADKKATGIGLYLSGKILDKLNHRIFIQSELGRGTSVRIEFNSHINLLTE